MRYRLTLVAALLALTGGCAAPGHGGGTGAWIGPSASLGYGSLHSWDSWPGDPGPAWSRRHRPTVACDSFGRCWRVGPSDPFDRGFGQRARPPGWAEDLPRSARADDRFLRPRSDVVCDRASRICYKDGRIDKSDTERVFGERAGDRADDLRDRFGTGKLFVSQRGVACDRERKLCLEDGDPDRKLTRRYFGRRAARAVEDEHPRRDDARKGKRRGKRKQG